MKLFKWQDGRQGTGYKVLTLINSKLLKFDCHILKYPEGSSIPLHTDPAREGYKHYRLNFLIKDAEKGGEFHCHWTHVDLWRIRIFRPDLVVHSVAPIIKGTRYILSIGWLKKE